MSGLIRLISFFVRLSQDIPAARLAIGVIVFSGLVAGLASTGIIAVINALLVVSGAAKERLTWAFIALCVILPTFRLISQSLVIFVSQRCFLALRLKLSRGILSAPLPHLERVGPNRLLATMTSDMNQILDAFRMVPLVCLHVAAVISCLVYLGWLSWGVLLKVLVFMVLGIITYYLPVMRALGYIARVRELLDALTKHIRSLTEGIKELKMHQFRREAFLSDLKGTALSMQREGRIGGILFAAASSWGQTLFFVLVGLLLLVLPNFEEIEASTLIGYTLVLFFMMTPLEVILNTLPVMGAAAVAADKVERLGLSLVEVSTEGDPEAQTTLNSDWGRLELVDVRRSYTVKSLPPGGPHGGKTSAGAGEESKTFSIGPISLSFEPGELVFLIGGNGSGKTTLAKVLLGLYPIESGEIRFAGEAVTDANRDSYREHFSVVFSDFFLFERLLGLDEPVLDEDARRYLKDLQLEEKVRVEEGVLSTLDLSQGQRKRLALLTSYLEDRPIYLFDEWAADQDPAFKEVFYLELLPQLKSRGKTVFVISHDDHYYHVADRIVKMDYGKVEYDRKAAEFLQSVEASGATQSS